VHLILFRLGRAWFSSATAGLVRLGWPRGTEIRWWPYIVRAGDGCEVRRYRGKVLIALVSVLAIMPLAVIYAVAYAYGN